MAEASKKKPRKSKLVLRECLDIEDESKSSTQMQAPVQEASQTLLPKLKNAIDNETYFEKSPSPVQFSIQVDVESCFYDEDIHSQDMEDINVEELNKLLPNQEVIISNDQILEEVVKLSSSKSYTDRKLQVEVRKFLGKGFTPHVPDRYEAMVQAALIEWKNWYSQSKLRIVILAFKCNICSIGWWNLGPFQEHIRVHKEISLNIDTCNHECCIVAAQGQWFESMCLCKIEGNCPKCLKTYEQHHELKKETMYYHCIGCHCRFTTCGSLFIHEGECVRYEKIIYQNTILNESMWKCDVCNVFCLTQQRYEEHHILSHSVRSDNPAYLQTMKTCVYCSNQYHIFGLHACPTKMENTKCNYCNRRFQNKQLADIHMNNTKKDHCCKICKRFLKSQCMEAEHLLKHSKNFLLTYKCCDCLDNVLMFDEYLLRKHKLEYHKRKIDKRRDLYTIIVPRICMSTTSWAGGVTVADMAYDRASNKQLKDNAKTTVEAVEKVKPNKPTLLKASNDIIKQRNNIKVSNVDKETLDQMCSDLKNKMLQRACANAVQIQNQELLNAIEGLKNENTNESSLSDRIKKEIVDDNIDTDDDIKETQNSVDALLCYVGSNNIAQDDIKIVEPNWDHIVIDDSDCGISADEEHTQESIQECINKKESEHQNVNLAIVKNEPISDNEDGEENSVSSENGNMKTEVTIKEEKHDYVEYNEDGENDIKKEHDACLEELSKVFRASKDVGTVELSGISLAEEIDIKDEPLDEDDYEDDIIMLCNDKTRFDTTTETVAKKNAEEKTTDKTKDLNSDMDLSQFKPDVKIKQESPQSKTDEKPNLESVIPKSFIARSDSKSCTIEKNRKIKRKVKQKLYRCNKCSFVSDHRGYQEHKATICLRKKHKTPRKTLKRPTPALWLDINCTKCDSTFISVKSYATHFTAHDLKQGRCPRCRGVFLPSDLTNHLISHIKNSFMKLQLLNQSSYITSKNTGLYQCKTCQDKVKFKQFFTHWEKHLDLNAEVEESQQREEIEDEEEDKEESQLVIDVDDTDSEDTPKNFQLTPEKLKMALDQLQSPMDSRYSNERDRKCCLVCKRKFSRRNDVKRHIVEHLLRDAQSRVPGLMCQLCQYKTNKPYSYKAHMRNHAALPVFKCEICEKWFSDSSNFAKHKKVHNVNVLSQCELCTKKFNSKHGLDKHMEMHRSTEPIKCELCDRTFFTESSYKKHVKGKHERHGLKRYCRICMARFTTMQSIWSHMWEVHKERRQKADCPLCGKQFRKQQDVRTHLRDIHNVVKMSKKSTVPRAPRRSEDDIESFLEKHDEIEIDDDGDETLIVYYNNDEDDDDLSNT